MEKSAMHQDRVRDGVEERMRAGPDVLVGRNVRRLVGRRGVEPGCLIPEPRLVDSRAIPQKKPRRIGKNTACMNVMFGSPGSSSHFPPIAFSQRAKSTGGHAFPPGSGGSPVVALRRSASARVSQTVCVARTNPASPCIMCISTWQWNRKSPRRWNGRALCGR